MYNPVNVAADVAALRGAMRNTPVGRLQNLGPRGKGTLAALLVQLPAKAQQAARELSADVTALRQREELIKARLAGASAANASLPPPMVLLEVQQELADRCARLLAVAGPSVGEALLRLLTHAQGDAAMRAALGVPAAEASASASASSPGAWGSGGGGGGGGSVYTATHSVRSVVQGRNVNTRGAVANSRAAATLAHTLDQRSVVAHVSGVIPQVGWGSVVNPLATASSSSSGSGSGSGSGSSGVPGGGWLPTSKLVPHVSRTKFAPPLPPPPATSLTLDGILPDGSRDLWGIVSKARSSAITGEHLAGGLASTRSLIFADNPENVNYYARAVKKYGATDRGETSISGLWAQVYGTEPQAAASPPPPPQRPGGMASTKGPWQPTATSTLLLQRAASPSRGPALRREGRAQSPEQRWLQSLRGGAEGARGSREGEQAPLSLSPAQHTLPPEARGSSSSSSSARPAAAAAAAAAGVAGELQAGDFRGLSSLRAAAAASSELAGGQGADRRSELESWFSDAQALQDMLSR